MLHGIFAFGGRKLWGRDVMSYRIFYGRKVRRFRILPLLLGLGMAGAIWMYSGGYDALARYVGGMILGAH